MSRSCFAILASRSLRTDASVTPLFFRFFAMSVSPSVRFTDRLIVGTLTLSVTAYTLPVSGCTRPYILAYLTITAAYRRALVGSNLW